MDALEIDAAIYILFCVFQRTVACLAVNEYVFLTDKIRQTNETILHKIANDSE